MFGIGSGELFIVAGLALVVVGPGKLPDFVKQASRVMGQIKEAGREFKRSVDPDNELETAMNKARGEFVDLPPGLDNEHMVCRPEEEWAAAIAAAEEQGVAPKSDPAALDKPAERPAH